MIQKKSLYAALFVSLLLVWGCSTPVTNKGKPVEDIFAVRSAQTVKTAEILATHLLQFMQEQATLHPENPKAVESFEKYVKNVAPKVQFALDESRKGIKTYLQNPTIQGQKDIEVYLQALMNVLRQAQELAQAQGWKE